MNLNEILAYEQHSRISSYFNNEKWIWPAYKTIADKYKGKTIEFDGYTADVAHNEGYKTRFNYLIYVGDYNSSPVVGLCFQIKGAVSKLNENVMIYKFWLVRYIYNS